MKRTLTGSKKEKENGEDGVDTIINENKSPKKTRTISALPGGELLSEREKKLCHSIGMKPSSYITIKTCIIKDYLQRRQGMQVKIRYPKHLDKTHRRKILNFLNENGWIGGIGALWHLSVIHTYHELTWTSPISSLSSWQTHWAIDQRAPRHRCRYVFPSRCENTSHCIFTSVLGKLAT